MSSWEPTLPERSSSGQHSAHSDPTECDVVPDGDHAQARLRRAPTGQRELNHGLQMWTEVKGIALVAGPSGVGKSITVRRFISGLDDARFRVIEFTYLPSTITGCEGGCC